MDISHSTTKPDAYQLHVGRFQIGAAKKTAEGFYANLLTGEEIEAPTMKALKENGKSVV